MGINSVKKYTIPALLLFVLVFRWKVQSFRTGYDILVIDFICAMISLMLIEKKMIPEALFLLLCLFSAHFPALTLRSLEALKTIMLGMVAYYLLATMKYKFDYFLNALCVACMFHIAFLFIKAVGMEPYAIYGMTTQFDGIGLTANPNESSAMIALCLPAFFRRKWWVLMPALMVGLYLSKSFGGALASSMIFAAFALKHGHKFTACMIVLSLLFAFVYFNPGQVRFEMMLEASKRWFEHNTVFGFGLGHWQHFAKKFEFMANTKQYFHRAHNSFFQAWFEMGMLFIPIVIIYARNTIKKAIGNDILIYALIAIFIVCNCNSAFRINALNGLIMIFWLANIERLYDLSNMPAMRRIR